MTLNDLPRGVIYLASPYTHTDARVVECRYMDTLRVTAAMLCHGLFVYSPIVHCHALAKAYDLPTDALYWRGYNFAMVERSDVLAVLTLDGWDTSKGIEGEVGHAKRLGRSIFTVDPELCVDRWGQG